MGCSPAEPTSASPVLHSFSLNPAAVQSPAANRNCLYFSLSQQRGPLHRVPSILNHNVAGGKCRKSRGKAEEKQRRGKAGGKAGQTEMTLMEMQLFGFASMLFL